MFHISKLTVYNYRLLMRSTRYHVDRVRYWLTDAVAKIPDHLIISDKIYPFECPYIRILG